MLRESKLSLRASESSELFEPVDRPSWENTGMTPPFVEICFRGPGPGNAVISTSSRPDSLETWAIQRPSREKAAECSEKAVLKKGRVRRSPC